MVYDNLIDIAKNKNPGDRAAAVRKGAYRETPPELWPMLTPVEGTLQSCYFDHPSQDPEKQPPRHLMPDHPDQAHPWDSAWWDLEHWVVCDTPDEALAELERQARQYIAEAKRRASALESLLPETEAEPVGPDGCLKDPPIYKKDMTATYDEAMPVLDGPEDASKYSGDDFGVGEFAKHVAEGGISDYDGSGDLAIDGKIYANAWVCCSARRVYLGDVYEIPFGRLEKLFAGHDVRIRWYNK